VVSCGLPNPLDCYSGSNQPIKYQRLSGRPRIWGRPLNEFSKTFPIKAPTRQMLYPLSYRGATCQMIRDVSMGAVIWVNGLYESCVSFAKIKETDPLGAVSLVMNDWKSSYAARGCSVLSAYTRLPFKASSMISRTADVSGFTSMRSQARKCLRIPSVAISTARPVSFEYRRA
jgi:hypothetical protein